MAIHMHIGFIEREKMLRAVDRDFLELVKLSYQIPGFGSYGVSCSGHFYPADDTGNFWPSPWAHLGFAALPEQRHIIELIELISETTKQDPDAHLAINDNKNPPINFPKYSPDLDLSKFTLGKTSSGLYVAKLEVRLGENGSLASLGEYFGGSLKVKEHQEVLDKTKQRYEEIKKFWKTLENKVREYTEKHGFTSQPDYSKPEFLPFG